MQYELVVIGAGISGLSAAISAYEKGVERVLLVEHEKEMGGVASQLSQSDEFKPERQLLRQAAKIPYQIKHQSTVIGFFPGEQGDPHQLCLQSPNGTEYVEAKKIMLCSGSLEKPREAHRIAGSRPAGVMTARMALNLMARNYKPGEKIMLVENGRISKAVATLLAEQGCQVESWKGEEWEIVKINGISRVNQIEVRHRVTGEDRIVHCDTLIFSQNRIPATFYLKGTPVKRDKQLSIMVDDKGKTNIPFISAAGTCTQLGDDHHLSSIELAKEAIHELLRS